MERKTLTNGRLLGGSTRKLKDSPSKELWQRWALQHEEYPDVDGTGTLIKMSIQLLLRSKRHL